MRTAPSLTRSLKRPHLGAGVGIDWRSPLREDGNADYRDSDFLE